MKLSDPGTEGSTKYLQTGQHQEGWGNSHHWETLATWNSWPGIPSHPRKTTRSGHKTTWSVH